MPRTATPRSAARALTLALALTLAPGSATSAAPAAPAAPSDEAPTALPPTLEDRAFKVFLDDREVGEHVYRFAGTPEDFRVESRADFEVKIAFVTVFSYDHEADEQWVDGCMVALESTTDTSDDFRVSGERTAGGFSVDTGDGGQTHDVACAWGFAYWNPAMRARERLINPQDGKLFEVTIEELEPRPLSVGDRSVRTRVWSLTAEKLDLTLYYDDQDRWLGLDSVVRGGRTLRYRPDPSDPFYPG